MNSIYKTLSEGHGLENLKLLQKIAKGNTLDSLRSDSVYQKLEVVLLKSKTFAIGQLMKQLTNRTASRFLNEHKDYKLILKDMKHLKFVIKQNNPLKLFFNVIVNIAIVYSVINTLYNLSFGMMEPNLSVLEIIVWVVFIIDFLLNFMTEVIDNKSYPIRNIKLISIRYLKTWLIPDFLALIPLKMLGFPETEYFFRLSRTFKVQRIFYTFSIKNFTRYLKDHSVTITAKKQKILFAIENFSELGFEVCKFLFFTYFFACSWYFLCQKVIESSFKGDNFIDHYQLYRFAIDEQLIICIYFIFTTLSTVGYGDYRATNYYEMGLTNLIMFTGAAWLALTMSKVMSFVKEFKKIGKPKDNLNELTVFIHNLEHIHGPMPALLKSKLFSHFIYFWKHNRLGSLMNPDCGEHEDKLLYTNDKTLRKLPEYIKREIFEYLFEDYFNLFFKFFGKNDGFRYDICLYLQPRYFNNEFILFMEEKAKELLFVKSGTIEVGFLKYDDVFVRCFNLSSGVIIGENGVFLDENSFADLKGEKVHGMALSENSVIGILARKYPERLKKYRNTVKKRVILLKDTLKSSENFEYRGSRTRIQARLSNVFHRTQVVKEGPTLQEIYSNLKDFKKKFEKLSKDFKDFSNEIDEN